MSEKITAQALYDERDAHAQISGTDLHEVFRALLDGEPSPAGATPIDVDALISLMHATTDPDVSQFIQDVLTA